MEQFVISAVNRFGYIAVMLLIALENIFPPIPSEVILTFAGFAAANSALKLWLVCLYATLGSVLGAVALYFAGAYINSQTAKKWGRRLRFRNKDIKRAREMFAKRGNMFVLFGRFVPVVRSLVSIPAGANKMPFLRFLALTCLGTGVWNVALVSAGAVAGEHRQYINMYINKFSLAVVLTVCAVFLVILVKKMIAKRLNKCKNSHLQCKNVLKTPPKLR